MNLDLIPIVEEVVPGIRGIIVLVGIDALEASIHHEEHCEVGSILPEFFGFDSVDEDVSHFDSLSLTLHRQYNPKLAYSQDIST